MRRCPLPRHRKAKETLKATDIGVTPTTIRVAVVTDVDNSSYPGVLQGIVDGVQGWGKYVNANGGLAGPQGAGRLHRLAAEPERGPERDHQGVRSRTSRSSVPGRCC